MNIKYFADLQNRFQKPGRAGVPGAGELKAQILREVTRAKRQSAWPSVARALITMKHMRLNGAVDPRHQGPHEEWSRQPREKECPSLPNAPPARLDSEITSASGYQIEDQDDQRYDQQKVNQAAGNMKAETQEPQNEDDDKDCPKHGCSFFCVAGA
jgi:hypothetical protein